MTPLATDVIHRRMEDYTPFSPEVLAEPSAAYAYLRSEPPVHRCEFFRSAFLHALPLGGRGRRAARRGAQLARLEASNALRALVRQISQLPSIS